ncbi:hypothetical protein [uncultured Algibacter sp.]|uniref:hypothetical protein n=1 Tax=uncultured Algibacter sp. TaxID=298659 RepID=UPI00262B96A5|nr:hypothetical protein [uncultured Algibacter sp.]
MKKLFAIILTSLIISCSGKVSDCEKHSSAYWTTTIFGKPHNTRIEGENFTIRKAFAEIKKSENNIEPKNGFITLRLHLDKYGSFCNQENFQINTNYQPIEFNDGKLIKKLEKVSSKLNKWKNDTETKTYYLIRFTIKDGRIEEIF